MLSCFSNRGRTGFLRHVYLWGIVDMADRATVEKIDCPCCGSPEYSFWAEERGFTAVRCLTCKLIYANPRPVLASIDESVRLGEHRLDGQTVDVKARRSKRKVAMYRTLLGRLFAHRIGADQPLTWVDFGAGYGEVIEAVSGVAPPGSEVIGIEPMAHKVAVARQHGLTLVEGYPERAQFQADVVSIVNVFSHVPDFHNLLRTAATNLKPGGEVFIETGNLADLDHRSEFNGILDLPDHLVFSGESQMARYLASSGFEIVAIQRQRTDGLIDFAKLVVKRLLRRPVRLRVPYSSRYRQLMIRAQATEKSVSAH